VSAHDSSPEPVDHDIRMSKHTLRSAISSERRKRSPEETRKAAQGLRDVFMELPLLRAGPRVAVYVSHHGELSTWLLRVALAARGVCVVLPTMSRSGELRWSPDTVTLPDGGGGWLGRGDSRCARRGRTGVEVVLVPALAVDTRGRRLGRGCDGYDLILRQVDPLALVLGAVHDAEVLDAAVEPVPDEPHDVPVHAVITPSRILYLSGEWSAPGRRMRTDAA